MIDAFMTSFTSLHPVSQAAWATGFTWAVTAAGASLVFFAKNISQRFFDASLGFAAGVMIAASFWSLLAPSIALAEEMGFSSWMPAAVGFLAGGATLWIADKILPHLHLFAPEEEREGIQTQWKRSILLVMAITLHNIPEGLAVGVAFGAAAAGLKGATVASAIALAIGIGLQNFPEGTAISLPLRREGFSRGKSFFYGQLSAVVEPIAGILGAAAVLVMRPILPFALSFAAGAMIFVVIEEVIPESQYGKHADLATLGAMGGFVIMMILDVALS